MVKTVTKLETHTVSIAQGYSSTSYPLPNNSSIFWNQTTDAPYSPGQSAGTSYSGWPNYLIADTYYGNNATLDYPGHTPSINQTIVGYVNGKVVEIVVDPNGNVGYQYSQDLSTPTTGSVTITMTKRAAMSAVTGLAWSGLNPPAFYGVAGTASYFTTFGPAPLPTPIGPQLYALKMDYDDDNPIQLLYAFPNLGYDIKSLGGTDCAHQPDGDDILSVVGFWDDATYTSYKRYLIRWQPNALTGAAEYEEIRLSDDDDNDLFYTQLGTTPGMAGYVKAVKIAPSKWGWFISIDAYDAGVHTRKYFQVDPTFSFYREILFSGSDSASIAVLNTTYNTTSVQQDYYGNLMLWGYAPSAGDRILATPVQEQPEWPERTGTQTVRSWTYTLDGHDYYVLRLGLDATLVYDTYSEQWSEYASLNNAVWALNSGFNWQGAVSKGYGSEVVVGDDETGQLYFLEPEQGYDEGNTADLEYFERVAMAQVSMQGRKTAKCDVIYLEGDNLAGFNGTVLLETSDDNGYSFDDQGTVTTQLGNHSQEYSWRSLGLISAPGRLFKITDYGTFARIDNLEMNDNES